MVSKVCTHKKFSLRVRMKRSATPLPSGWRTKEGEPSMPRKAISAWKSPDMWLEPWSWRRARPLGASFPLPPKRHRPAVPVRAEKAVPAYETPDPPGRGADAGMAQPGPDLPVALSMQARAEDPHADVLDQLGIGAGPDRTSAHRAGWCRGTGRRAMAVDRGAGEAPDAGPPRQAPGAGPRPGRA